MRPMPVARELLRGFVSRQVHHWRFQSRERLPPTATGQLPCPGPGQPGHGEFAGAEMTSPIGPADEEQLRAANVADHEHPGWLELAWNVAIAEETAAQIAKIPPDSRDQSRVEAARGESAQAGH